MCCRLCVPGLGITRVRFNGYNLSPRYGEHPFKKYAAKVKQKAESTNAFRLFL